MITLAIIGIRIYGLKLIDHFKKKHVNSEFFDERLRNIDFKKLQSYPLVHFHTSPTNSLRGFLVLLRIKMMHKKIIVYWTGTDVLRANAQFVAKFFTKLSKPLIDAHVTNSPKLAKELKKIKITSKPIKSPTFNLYSLKKLPHQKKIAVYLPERFDSDWDFYQGNIIKKLVKTFPEVEFIIIGNRGENFSEKNVTCLKWVDNMEDIYSNVLAVIRLPIHDGLSSTSLEALSMGRTMITTSDDIPYCLIANTFDEVNNHLKKVLENPTLNIKGSEYVHKNYDLNKLTNNLISIYEDIERTS